MKSKRATLLALASSVATPFENAQLEAGSTISPVEDDATEMYAAKKDGGHTIPAVVATHMKPEHVRQVVQYRTVEAPGTVIVDQTARHLYFVLTNGKAIRYVVGVGPIARAFPGGVKWRLHGKLNCRAGPRHET